jgi:hypothetical protein
MFNIFKGWLGEKTTQLGMWIKLDSKIYKRFHNLILTRGSWTTQIDHVVLSPYGLFVIEAKNFDGWIFGSETGKVWTQVLHGSKRTFQNPLHQNYGHTKVLAEHLQVDHSRVHSIVFFIGEAELKTELPSNVMTSGLSDYVDQFHAVVFSATEMAWIEDELSRLENGSSASTREHIANVRERYSSNTTCPKCGSPLVTRIARWGGSAGKSFLGCSGFPKCRYTRGEGRDGA